VLLSRSPQPLADATMVGKGESTASVTFVAHPNDFDLYADDLCHLAILLITKALDEQAYCPQQAISLNIQHRIQ
jgi:hypothetical protein